MASEKQRSDPQCCIIEHCSPEHSPSVKSNHSQCLFRYRVLGRVSGLGCLRKWLTCTGMVHMRHPRRSDISCVALHLMTRFIFFWVFFVRWVPGFIQKFHIKHLAEHLKYKRICRQFGNYCIFGRQIYKLPYCSRSELGKTCKYCLLALPY